MTLDRRTTHKYGNGNGSQKKLTSSLQVLTRSIVRKRSVRPNSKAVPVYRLNALETREIEIFGARPGS